jgi:hypothetical protein
LGRHACTAPGQEGARPLDAELRVPAHGYADRWREWAVDGATDESSRESQTVLERLVGGLLSLQALETGVAEAGQDVMTLYEPPAAPTTPPSVGPILVVQADGTGVPMVQPPPQTPSMRLGKGQKRGKKMEAVVTGLYTIAPYPRTPQDVAAALRPEPGRLAPAARPPPIGKARRATLAGKADARRRLAERVAPRDGPHIPPHVARTDGTEAVPQQVVTHVPASTLILDVIQATESLGDTANALVGETHPHRTMGVRAYLEPLLTGQTEAVIIALEAEAKAPTGTAPQRQAVRRTVGYSRRNQPYRRYDEYLAQGWPIGTGVVEGACRHLVNERMEPSGMRWTNTGAQAVLDLRAVRLNGQWEAYGPFHRHQNHRRLYGMSVQVPEKAEAQALTLAA